MKRICAYILMGVMIMVCSMPVDALAGVTALRPGDEGSAVTILQEELMRKGFYTYPQITGYYGAETEMAVRAFQQSVKLSRDGVAGKVTLQTLFGKNFEGAMAGASILGGNNAFVSAARNEESAPDTVSTSAYITSAADNNVLKKGQVGEAVSQVQERLASLGYLNSIDGEFGSATESAVISFQIASGLLPDGEVGPRTFSALRDSGAVTKSQAPAAVSPNMSRAAQAVAIAKQFLGAKYVYATSGPVTFDCSGLTLYVFRQLGITMEHTTRLQSQMGTYISYENLQMGDMVFFDTIPGNGLQYDHVGIYIANGQFIHAASGSTGRVTVSSLASGYYRNAFTNARRVL